MTTKPTIYLCLDIETGGQIISKHPLLQIGMVAMDENENKIMFKKDYYFQPHNYEPTLGKESFISSFDKECLTNFWIKNNNELLMDIYTKAKPIRESLMEFIKDFEKLESQYTLIIISDNPALDYSFVNYYLGFYGNHRPLNIDENNGFRALYDTRSYAMAAVRKKFDHTKLSAKNIAYWLEFELPENNHTHIASDDATQTLKLFLLTKKNLLQRSYVTETGVVWY